MNLTFNNLSFKDQVSRTGFRLGQKAHSGAVLAMGGHGCETLLDEFRTILKEERHSTK